MAWWCGGEEASGATRGLGRAYAYGGRAAPSVVTALGGWLARHSDVGARQVEEDRWAQEEKRGT